MIGAKREVKFCKLRGALVERGFDQSDIARLLGITNASVSNRLNGTIQWRLDEIYKILSMLDIPVEQIHEYFPSPI